RGPRPEAHRDGSPRIVFRAEGSDKSCRFVDHRDLCVAKSVDRLLTVSHDEDRWRERSARGARSFRPRSNELGHELPPRTARVMEFVYEHMLISRLESKAAFGKLVHLPQQLDSSLQDAREIDERVRLQRALVCAERDGIDPPDTARHHDVQIATKASNSFGN